MSIFSPLVASTAAAVAVSGATADLPVSQSPFPTDVTASLVQPVDDLRRMLANPDQEHPNPDGAKQPPSASSSEPSRLLVDPVPPPQDWTGTVASAFPIGGGDVPHLAGQPAPISPWSFDAITAAPSPFWDSAKHVASMVTKGTEMALVGATGLVRSVVDPDAQDVADSARSALRGNLREMTENLLMPTGSEPRPPAEVELGKSVEYMRRLSETPEALLRSNACRLQCLDYLGRQLPDIVEGLVNAGALPKAVAYDVLTCIDKVHTETVGLRDFHEAAVKRLDLLNIDPDSLGLGSPDDVEDSGHSQTVDTVRSVASRLNDLDSDRLLKLRDLQSSFDTLSRRLKIADRLSEHTPTE